MFDQSPADESACNKITDILYLHRFLMIKISGIPVEYSSYPCKPRIQTLPLSCTRDHTT